MGDVGLCVNDDSSTSPCSSHRQCRICHEEDDSSESMENPCSCSGSIKFAHRDCIQRWCDEKGNTICEICHKKFEPGYSAPPQPAPKIASMANLTRITVGGLEAARRNTELRNPGLMVITVVDDEFLESEGAVCSSSEKTSSCFQSILVALSLALLLRHLWLVFSSEEDYDMPLTIFLLRAVGILVPLLILFKVVSVMERTHARRWREEITSWTNQEEEEEQQQHVIHIHS